MPRRQRNIVGHSRCCSGARSAVTYGQQSGCSGDCAGGFCSQVERLRAAAARSTPTRTTISCSIEPRCRLCRGMWICCGRARPPGPRLKKPGHRLTLKAPQHWVGLSRSRSAAGRARLSHARLSRGSTYRSRSFAPSGALLRAYSIRIRRRVHGRRYTRAGRDFGPLLHPESY
eukprot:COSAG02_NODE_334_length_24367_cov_6.715634_18_plen_173_part_00